jgi:hypothetical protein
MNMATSIVGGVIDQQSLGQLGMNFGYGALKDTMSMMGPVGMLGNAAMGMFSSENPTATMGSFAGGIIGSALGGPWGGLAGSAVGGYAGGKLGESVKDGMIGDALDHRSYEGYRDSLEEGMSRQQAASYAEQLGYYEGLMDKANRDSISAPDPGKFGLGGNVADSFGNPASVGVTEGSPFGGASVSNPGSTEKGLNETPSLGDLAQGMFGGSSSDSSSGTDGGYGDPDAGGEGMI